MLSRANNFLALEWASNLLLWHENRGIMTGLPTMLEHTTYNYVVNQLSRPVSVKSDMFETPSRSGHSTLAR